MSLLIPPQHLVMPPAPSEAPEKHQRPRGRAERLRPEWAQEPHPRQPLEMWAGMRRRTVIPPQHGWRPQTYYVVDVSVSPSNPVWRGIMYSGFLNGPNSDPGGYSCVWSAIADKLDLSDLYYLRVVAVIGDIEGRQVRSSNIFRDPMRDDHRLKNPKPDNIVEFVDAVAAAQKQDLADQERRYEECEARVRATLIEEGEDPDSDSDHAMYLRQDILAELEAEDRRKFLQPGDARETE